MPLPDYVRKAVAGGLPDYVKQAAGLQPTEPAAANFSEAASLEPQSVAGLRLEQSTLGGVEREPLGADLISSIGTRLEKRGETIGQIADTGAESLPEPLQPAGKAALITGQVAGGVVDVVSETIFSAAEKLTPEPVKEAVKNRLNQFAQTEVGQLGIKAIQEGSKKYDSFKENFPDAALSLEGIFNIADLNIAGLLGKKAIKKTLEKKVVQPKSAIVSNKLLKKVVKEEFTKVAPPTIKGKRTAPQKAQFLNQATDATRIIVENKSKIKGEFANKLPETREEFGEVIHQNKLKEWAEVEKGLKEAGKAGATVKLDSLIGKMTRLANDPSIADFEPKTVSFINSTIKNLTKRGSYTPQEAQKIIKNFNVKLNNFYSGRVNVDSDEMFVKSFINNHLKASLDDTVESVTGKGVKGAKKRYSSLRAIEDDVGRAALNAAKQKDKTLIDYTDIFTIGEVAAGLTSGNAGLVVKGASGKGVKEYFKFLNNPDRRLKKMFGKADKILSQVEKPTKIPNISILKDQKEISELGKIIRKIDFDLPTFKRKGTKLSTKGVKLKQAEVKGRAESSSEVFDEVLRIAKTPEGKRLLIERLSKEEKYSKLVDTVKSVPTTKALPPGQGFELVRQKASQAKLTKGKELTISKTIRLP